MEVSVEVYAGGRKVRLNPVAERYVRWIVEQQALFALPDFRGEIELHAHVDTGAGSVKVHPLIRPEVY